MLGAIIGDIAGSRFEFDNGGWRKDFKFITEKCDFTDDTVMTIAVGQALMESGEDSDDETVKANCIKYMQKWGRKYPFAGYGSRFIFWLGRKNPEPYNSWGNGSAMRVSRAGWLYPTLEKTRHMAALTARVSHNHPEGIKGAECTRSVIFMARNGRTKDEIKAYVNDEFGYDTSMSVDEMRLHHRHDESCMDSLPKALVSFYEGNSYEDTVRNAVSLGGDTDTIAAIAGSMARAFYCVPESLENAAYSFIDDEMKEILAKFKENIMK